MRYLSFLLLLLLFACDSSTETKSLQDKSHEQQSGTENDLLCCYFINEYVGWAAGTHGTLVHTTDGGQTWLAKTIGKDVTINDIIFVDEKHGFAVGGIGGQIHETTNGGLTWFNNEFHYPETYIYGIDFYNVGDLWTGYICGNRGVIAKTEDIGQTWSIEHRNDDMSFYSIAVIGDSPMAVGKNYPTSSGVWAWKLMGSWLMMVDSTGDITQYSSVSTGRYKCKWITRNGAVKKKTIIDGNTAYIKTNLPDDYFYTDVAFATELSGIVLTSEDKYFFTSDGGETWSLFITDNEIKMNDVFFADEENGWIVGNSGTIYKVRLNNGGFVL